MVYFCLENFSPSNIEEQQNPIITRETEIEKQPENRIIPQNDYVQTVSEIPRTRKYNIDLIGGDIFDDTPDKKIDAFKVKVTNTGLQMLEDDMKKKKMPELGNKNYKLGNRGVTDNVLQNSFIKQNVDFNKKSSNYDYSEIIANANRMKATEHDSNVLQYYETNTKIDHVKDLDENGAMIILPAPNVMKADSKRIFVPRSEISTNNQRLHLNSDFANRGMEVLESLETQNEDNNNNDLIDHSYFSEDNHSPQKENRAFIEPPSMVETYNTQMEKPGLDMHIVPLNLGVKITDLENPVGQIFVVKDIKNQRTLGHNPIPGKNVNYPKHFSDNDQNRGLLYLETQNINEPKETGTDDVEQGLTNPELQSEPSNVEQQVSVTRPPFKQIEHTKLFNDLEKFIETKGLGNSEENMRRVIYATENLYDSIEVGVDDKPNKSRISQSKEEEEPDKKALKNDKMLNENIYSTEDNASEIEKDTGHLDEEDRKLEKPELGEENQNFTEEAGRDYSDNDDDEEIKKRERVEKKEDSEQIEVDSKYGEEKDDSFKTTPQNPQIANGNTSSTSSRMEANEEKIMGERAENFGDENSKESKENTSGTGSMKTQKDINKSTMNHIVEKLDDFYKDAYSEDNVRIGAMQNKPEKEHFLRKIMEEGEGDSSGKHIYQEPNVDEEENKIKDLESDKGTIEKERLSQPVNRMEVAAEQTDTNFEENNQEKSRDRKNVTEKEMKKLINDSKEEKPIETGSTSNKEQNDTSQAYNPYEISNNGKNESEKLEDIVDDNSQEVPTQNRKLEEKEESDSPDSSGVESNEEQSDISKSGNKHLETDPSDTQENKDKKGEETVKNNSEELEKEDVDIKDKEEEDTTRTESDANEDPNIVTETKQDISEDARMELKGISNKGDNITEETDNDKIDDDESNNNRLENLAKDSSNEMLAEKENISDLNVEQINNSETSEDVSEGSNNKKEEKSSNEKVLNDEENWNRKKDLVENNSEDLNIKNKKKGNPVDITGSDTNEEEKNLNEDFSNRSMFEKEGNSAHEDTPENTTQNDNPKREPSNDTKDLAENSEAIEHADREVKNSSVNSLSVSNEKEEEDSNEENEIDDKATDSKDISDIVNSKEKHMDDKKDLDEKSNGTEHIKNADKEVKNSSDTSNSHLNEKTDSGDSNEENDDEGKGKMTVTKDVSEGSNNEKKVSPNKEDILEDTTQNFKNDNPEKGLDENPEEDVTEDIENTENEVKNSSDTSRSDSIKEKGKDSGDSNEENDDVGKGKMSFTKDISDGSNNEEKESPNREGKDYNEKIEDKGEPIASKDVSGISINEGEHSNVTEDLNENSKEILTEDIENDEKGEQKSSGKSKSDSNEENEEKNSGDSNEENDEDDKKTVLQETPKKEKNEKEQSLSLESNSPKEKTKNESDKTTSANVPDMNVEKDERDNDNSGTDSNKDQNETDENTTKTSKETSNQILKDVETPSNDSNEENGNDYMDNDENEENEDKEKAVEPSKSETIENIKVTTDVTKTKDEKSEENEDESSGLVHGKKTSEEKISKNSEVDNEKEKLSSDAQENKKNEVEKEKDDLVSNPKKLERSVESEKFKEVQIPEVKDVKSSMKEYPKDLDMKQPKEDSKANERGDKEESNDTNVVQEKMPQNEERGNDYMSDDDTEEDVIEDDSTDASQPNQEGDPDKQVKETNGVQEITPQNVQRGSDNLNDDNTEKDVIEHSSSDAPDHNPENDPEEETTETTGVQENKTQIEERGNDYMNDDDTEDDIEHSSSDAPEPNQVANPDKEETNVQEKMPQREERGNKINNDEFDKVVTEPNSSDALQPNDDNDGQENTKFEEEKTKEKNYNPDDRSRRENEKDSIPQDDEIIDNERKRNLNSILNKFLKLRSINAS